MKAGFGVVTVAALARIRPRCYGTTIGYILTGAVCDVKGDDTGNGFALASGSSFPVSECAFDNRGQTT